MLAQWDKSKVYYTLQDVSHPDVMMTPYLREKLNEVMNYINKNKIQVRSALVLSPGFAGTMLKTFGGILNIRARYMIQRYFTDEAEAMAWLESEMKTERETQA